MHTQDEDAMKKRIAEMHPVFYQEALILTDHDEEKSKDLAQEAIYQMLKHLKANQDIARLKPWGYTIMKHKIIDDYRKFTYFQEYQSEQSYLYTHSGNKDSYIENPDNTLAVDEIKKTIYSIPSPYNETLELRGAGYSYEEIRQRLDITLEKVCYLLRKGKKILEECLKRNKFITFLLIILNFWSMIK